MTDSKDRETKTGHEENKTTCPEHLFNRKLVCIGYPGIVNNEENMLKTLGGIQSISKVYSEANRRLELRFRPDDVYCRPACSDQHKTTGLLLSIKVTRKKKKKPSTVTSKRNVEEDKRLKNQEVTDNKKCDKHEDHLSDGDITFSTRVIGRVDVTYKFKSFCDFQYLPMHYDGEKMINIHDTLVPHGLITPEWFDEPAEYFLPPATFSRMDTMQNYHYRQENADTEPCMTPYIIGRTRRRRSIYATFVAFSVPSIPSKPRDLALKYLKIKFLTDAHVHKLRELFEERPVWSKFALLAVTKFSADQLKYLLPAVAYYFVTGPFRILWVRFGYDPRKDPSSKIYQSIDFRIRVAGGLHNLIKAKRSYTNTLLPYKSGQSCKPKTLTINKKAIQTKVFNSNSGQKQFIPENSHIFRPGSVPPSRQMFYQLCDIKVPEIESMIARLPRVPPGTQCHRRLGWLPPGFAEHCRDILAKLVTEQLKKEQSQLCNEPQPSTSREAEPEPEIEEEWNENPQYEDMDWDQQCDEDEETVKYTSL